MTLCLQNLFTEMKEQRKKTKTDEGNFQFSKDRKLKICIEFDLDDDFIVVQQTNIEWPMIFDTYFLSPSTRLCQASSTVTSEDDLIFYVTRKIADDYHQFASVNFKKIFFSIKIIKYSFSSQKDQVEVFRHHDSKRQPKLVREIININHYNILIV